MCLTHSYIGVGREKEGRWERKEKGERERGEGRVRKPRKSKADGL